MILKLSIIIFTILFFALFGIVHGLRTRQLNGQNTSRKWHKVQAAMHVVFALFCMVTLGIAWKALVAPFLVLSLIWFTFDLSHNLTTGQSAFYLENSGINGWLKKKIREVGVLIVKIILIISLTVLFFIL